MKVFDSIVLGLGGMGSAAACHLARRGQKVLGLEQFGIAHDRGSSHGETRVIRRAYFEHPDYVPLLNRAYELWDELQAAAGIPLMVRCGLLLAGLPESAVIAGVKRAGQLHQLALTTVPAANLPERFPAFRFDENMEVLFEADAGFLMVEDCVRAHCHRATAHGAELHMHETVQSWKSDGAGVNVNTAKDRYTAKNLVICGGAWAARLLAELNLPLEVRRAVTFWLRPPPEMPGYDFRQGGSVFGFETPASFFYGIPAIDETGVKVAAYAAGEPVEDPTQLDRSLRAEDFHPVRRFAQRYLPGLGSEIQRHSVCMYTLTPDSNFIIDRHRDFPNVIYAAGFSGHGFKFASVIGSILADLSTEGKTGHAIDFLSAARPGLSVQR